MPLILLEVSLRNGLRFDRVKGCVARALELCGLSRLDLQPGLCKIPLEIGVEFHFADDGARENSSGVNVGGIVPGDQDAMPAETATDGQDVIAPGRE